MSLEKETSFNLFDYYKDLAKQQDIDISEIEGIPYVRNESDKWPSYLMGGEDPEENAIRLISHAMDRGDCPSFWIRELKQNDDFDERALKYGIRQINYWRGMELEKENCYEKIAPMEGIILERITGGKELKEWTALINSEVMSSKMIDYRIFRNVIDMKEFNFFRLALNKKTISTILIYLKDEVAGIYMVATTAKMRGRGFGKWITGEAIDYYIRKGIRKFVLHATSAGYPMYKSLGFSENNNYGIYWKIGKF